MDDDIKRLVQETCISLIPKYYDDVLEALRIQQIHDGIIEPFAAAIIRLNRNGHIQTMDADALSELEAGLGIAASGTLEQRRQAVIDAMCDMLIVNDNYAVDLARSASGQQDMQVDTDPHVLTLGVHRPTNTDDGEEISQISTAIKALKPMVPQNLVLYAQVNTQIDGDMVVSRAHRSAMSFSLGRIAYQPPPSPGPVPTEIYIGTSTVCPAGTVTLYSPYFWMYAFQNANSTNWYLPNYYQAAMPPLTDNSQQAVGGTRYAEVVLTNGTGGTFSPSTFQLAQWNDKPEFYMDSSYSSTDSNGNGTIVKFGSDLAVQRFDLPANMYSISGTTITWNMSHPLMVLLQGKLCTT